MSKRSRMMAEQDRPYRRTTARLGLVMLFMLLLFYGLNEAAGRIAGVLQYNSEITEAVVERLLEGAAYLLSFMLPVLLLRLITPPSERCVMPLAPRLPRRLWLLLPAGLGVIYTAATVNAVLLDWLGLSASSSGIQWIEGMALYEGVLLFLASVLIPAFCEELLFRGAVLSALRPYGKTTAILGSALLFALMHQTVDQLFYTAVAGVVLACLVLESGSIWAAVLLHMMNNLFAIAQSILYEQLGSAATVWICIGEVVVIGGGLLCLIYLIATKPREARVPYDTQERLSQPVKGFFTPPMIVYATLCALQMVVLLVLTGRLST